MKVALLNPHPTAAHGSGNIVGRASVSVTSRIAVVESAVSSELLWLSHPETQ